MNITEWDTEEAIAVNREEAWEEGMEKGLERGREEGMEESREEIARNALVKGASIEFIHEITGLDIEAIKALQAGIRHI